MPPRALSLLASLAALIGSADPAIAQADKWPGEIEHHFRLLRELIRKEDGPTEIYGLLSYGSQFVIEVKDGAAFLHCDDGNGRTRERQVRSDELAKLKRWLRANKVDELPPCDDGFFGHLRYEYVHLARDGTVRRVPINNRAEPKPAPAGNEPDSTPAPKPELYRTLIKRFSDLASVSMPVRYESIEKLPGFELIHTYERGDVERLSFLKGKLFASIRNEYPKKWHEVTRSGIATRGGAEPRNPLDSAFDPSSSSNYADATEGPYAGKRLWAGSHEKDNFEGLWASGAKGEPELIVRGTYGPFVLSPDGQWLVARTIARDQSKDRSISIARIDLPKKQVIPVTLPEADMFIPIAWIAAHQKVIFFRERSYGRVGPDEREYYLLDVATGNCERVTGEFRPLTDYNWIPRHLQSSSEADVVWATIVHAKPEHPGAFETDFGKYNTRHFTFSPLLHLPGVRVEPDQIFVDEATATASLIISGDLARIALPKAP